MNGGQKRTARLGTRPDRQRDPPDRRRPNAGGTKPVCSRFSQDNGANSKQRSRRRVRPERSEPARWEGWREARTTGLAEKEGGYFDSSQGPRHPAAIHTGVTVCTSFASALTARRAAIPANRGRDQHLNADHRHGMEDPGGQRARMSPQEDAHARNAALANQSKTGQTLRRNRSPKSAGQRDDERGTAGVV